MIGTLSLSQLRTIAKDVYKNGGMRKKVVRISSKPDFVDRTVAKAKVLNRKLSTYLR